MDDWSKFFDVEDDEGHGQGRIKRGAEESVAAHGRHASIMSAVMNKSLDFGVRFIIFNKGFGDSVGTAAVKVNG